MKINFLISEEKKELLIDKNMTFNEIKKKITNKYFKNKLDIEYINLEYISERPLREFGKYTINPGLLPMSFDNIVLNKFALEDKINFQCSCITDLTKFIT